MASVKISSYCEHVVANMSLTGGVATWQSQAWDLGFSVRETSAMVLHKFRVHQGIMDDTTIDPASTLIAAIGSRSLNGGAVNVADLTLPSVYCFLSEVRTYLTTHAFREKPLELDFSGLPQGGIIVPATKFYINANAQNRAATVMLTLELWLSIVELDQANLLDLLQSMLGFPV